MGNEHARGDELYSNVRERITEQGGSGEGELEKDDVAIHDEH